MKPFAKLTVVSLLCIASATGYAEPQIRCNTRGMDIDITFLTPSIARIHKYPEGTRPRDASLVVTKQAENVDIALAEDNNTVSGRSSEFGVSVDKTTGAVTFTSADGEKLLVDYSTSFTPALRENPAVMKVNQSFMLDCDEPIYGIGQVMDGKFNRRYSEHHMQNENMFTYSPYFMSPVKGYAVYSDNYSISDFNDNRQLLTLSQTGKASDYYFIKGDNPDKIIAGVRELTGHAPMLPLWAYGYFQSKERYHSQAESLDVLKKYRKLRIPIDCVIQDWRYWPEHNGTDSLWNSHSFDSARFPDPKAWVGEIHRNNAKLLIVAWPGFGPLTEQYKAMQDENAILDFLTWPPNSGARPYDVFNGKARDIYWNYLNKGIFSYIDNDGWWLDSTEPDHIERSERDYDVATALGSYRDVKNAYSLMHNTGIAEHQKAANRDKRVVILTRSGFIGQQRLGSNTWSGDVESSWEMLEKQIPAALNFTLMGIPNWNSDIGGFFAWRWNEGGGAKNPEFRELYNRWMQFGTFCPMMRSHGTDVPREIWQFGNPGEKWFESLAGMIRLRYRILPYIYSTSWDVSANDGTFMRPLIMDYSADTRTHDIGGQYMFGRNILVAPVTRPGVDAWDVYLPEGNDWWDFWDNRKINGGSTDRKPVTDEILPLYAKAGAIVPFGPDVQYSDEKKWDKLEIRVYPGADGSFVLYEDEFDNYNYEDGKFSKIVFTWDDSKRILTINEREGAYPGMLKKRNFHISIADADNTPGNRPAKAVKKISYNGSATKVKL